MSGSATSTMNELSFALHRNNEGVSMLLDDKDGEGVSFLRESLASFQRLLRCHGQFDCSMSSSPSSAQYLNSDSNKTTTGLTCESPSRKCLSPQVKTASLPRLQDEFLFTHDMLFFFDTNAVLSSTPPTYSDLNVFIAIVILNVSLAYHRQAVMGNTPCVAKAKTMYQMCSSLLVGRDIGLRHQEAGFLVLLAATNNLALINYQEGHFNASKQLFQRLAFLLATRYNYNIGCCNSEATLLRDEIVEGMSLNILVANSQRSAAAAA